jgi:hypothetical protein
MSLAVAALVLCTGWTCSRPSAPAAVEALPAPTEVMLWSLSDPDASVGDARLHLVDVKERFVQVDGVRRESPRATVEVHVGGAVRTVILDPAVPVDDGRWRLRLLDGGVARQDPAGPEQAFAKIRIEPVADTPTAGTP